jgi:crotonobetainyl-CoA:carnitine CoA-transferase CaiB-like acyl-CoA transferase
MKGQPVFTSYDPVLRENGLTVSVDHPLYGEIIRAAPPISFSETPGRVAPPCTRGQHNRSILTELGYSDGDITKFEELNVIIPPA